MSGLISSYSRDAADLAFRELMVTLRDEKERQKLSFSQMHEAAGSSHDAMFNWVHLRRQPHLDRLCAAFASVGMELWIVPRRGCPFPMEPLRIEPESERFWRFLRFEFLPGAFDACGLAAYQAGTKAGIGRNTVYSWLGGYVKPMARSLFRVLNLAGYTIEARESPTGG
jgi:hypothetical protein